MIKNVDICQNSTFHIIQHLVLLRPSINHLCSIFLNSTAINIKKKGKKLKDNLLTEEEFDICDELIIILNLFNEITEILGGSKYPTLSVVTFAIEELSHT